MTSPAELDQDIAHVAALAGPAQHAAAVKLALREAGRLGCPAAEVHVHIVTGKAWTLVVGRDEAGVLRMRSVERVEGEGGETC